MFLLADRSRESRHAARLRIGVVVCAFSLGMLSSGCVAVKVVDTAASAAVGMTKVATKVALKGVSTAVKVAVPDKKKDKNKLR